MTSSSIRMMRLAKEVQQLDNCWPIDEDRLDLLEAKITGEDGTPYENGSFTLRIEIPERYPFDPPRVRFMTKVYHPNIDKEGRICLEILKTNTKSCWKPTFNINTVLCAIKQLLSEPNPDDPLELEIAEEFLMNKEQFLATAKRWTALYASTDSEKAHRVPESTILEKTADLAEAEAAGPSMEDTDCQVDTTYQSMGLFSSKAKSNCGHNCDLNEYSSMTEQVSSNSPKLTFQSPRNDPATKTSCPVSTAFLSKLEPVPSIQKSIGNSQSDPKSNTRPRSAEKSSNSATSKRTKPRKNPNETDAKKSDVKNVSKQKKLRYEELFLDDDDD